MSQTTACSRQPLAGLRSQIVGIDPLSPVLDVSMRPYDNFDAAATTPVLLDALASIARTEHGASYLQDQSSGRFSPVMVDRLLESSAATDWGKTTMLPCIQKCHPVSRQ